MIDWSEIINAFFERSGFFFVPILSLAALFNLKELVSGKVRHSFMFVTASLLVSYIILGNGSARYILIPLLTFGCLTGAGAMAPARYLHKIPQLKWLKVQYLLIFFTVITLICSFLKLSLRDHGTVMYEFVDKLAVPADNVKIYSVNSPRGIILGSKLRNFPDKEFYIFKSWDAAMQQLALDQDKSENIYFFTNIPAGYTAEDLLQWIRGKYYLAPFEVIHSAKERSENYILLKFNHKILDGEQKFLRSNLLDMLPDTLPLTPYRQWGSLDIAEAIALQPQPYYVTNDGTVTANRVYFRKNHDVLPKRGTLQLRNNLTWLEAEREFKLITSNKRLPALKPEISANKLVTQADAPPLLTECRKIFIGSNQQFIHLSGANALWHPAENRFAFSGNREKHPARPGKFEYTAEDTILKTTSRSAFDIYQYDLKEIKNLRGNVLIIQEHFSEQFDLQKNLRTMLPAKINIQLATVSRSGYSSLHSANSIELPAGDFQVILLNLFSDAICREWTIPLNTDPFLDEHLTKLVQRLSKQYPNAVITLLLPPPPAPGYSMFVLLNSVKHSRLAHCNIVNAVYRWQQRSNLQNVEILPLYLSIDPENGYILDQKHNKIYSGFSFTDKSKRVIAENTAAFFIYLQQYKGKFQ